MYQAFISYSRQDERFVAQLHARLDRYRAPGSLAGTSGSHGEVPKRLHPVFRDRTDMSGGGDLSELVMNALNASEKLIVICSPAAATSTWVETEVAHFLVRNGAGKIFPVIPPGIGDVEDLEGSLFPPSLRGRGLLANDFRNVRGPAGRQIGDGQSLGFVKLVAGLLGIGVDRLLQRERRRQRATVAILAATAVSFAAIASAATWLGWVANRNASRADEALVRVDTALKKVLVSKAWDLLSQGELEKSAKYAIAGATLLPAQREDATEVLLASVFASRGGVLLPQAGAVLNLFSPDGGRLLIGSGGGEGESFLASLAVWNARTAELERVLSDRNDQVVALSMSQDGKRVAAAWQNGEIEIFALDGTSAHLVTRSEQPVSSLEISNSGKLVAFSADVNSAELWQTDNPRRLHRWDTETPVRQLSFAPDDRIIAISSAPESNGGITSGPGPRTAIFSTADGNAYPLTKSELFGAAPGWGQRIMSADTPSGPLLVLINETSHRWLRDAQTGSTRSAGPGSAVQIALVPQDYGPHDIPVFLTQSGIVREKLEAENFLARWGTGAVVTAIVMNARARTAVTGDMNGRVRLFRVDGYRDDEPRTIRAHSNLILGLALSPDGKGIAAGSLYGSRLWRSIEWPTYRTAEADLGFASGTYLPDGTLLTTPLEDSDPNLIAPLFGGDLVVQVIRPAAPGAKEFMKSHDRTFTAPRQDRWEKIVSIRAAADGSVVTAMTDQRRLLIWSAEGALLKTLEFDPPAYPLAVSRILGDYPVVAVAKDGSAVFVAGAGDTIAKINLSPDVTTTLPITAADAQTQVVSMAISPKSGHLLVSRAKSQRADEDWASVRLIDSDTGEEVFSLSQFFNGGVVDVAFSRDGEFAAVANFAESSISILNATTGSVISTIRTDGGATLMSRFSRDGKFVASLGSDGITLWSATSGRKLGSWPLPGFDWPLTFEMSPAQDELILMDESDLYGFDLSVLGESYDALTVRVCRDLLGQFGQFNEKDFAGDDALAELWKDRDESVCRQ